MTLVSSAQISGLVNSQQAMFYNDAMYANQISGQVHGYGAPQTPMTPAASGIAGLAPSAVAGAGGALPGMMQTAGMAAWMAPGMMGAAAAPLRALDPFGMAMAGGRMGFAAGGIGGGIAGAGLAAAPALAGYAAMQHVTSNVTAGMQEHIGFRSMMQDQFRFSGAGGRGFDTGALTQIESMLRSIDRSDVFTTFGELSRLVEKMNQQGMMAGVSNVQQFENRFKDVLNTTKTVASLMGTTLEAAMPFVGDIRRSGFYSAQDIMGQAFNRQVMGSQGFTGSQFTSVQRGGAAISQAYGGTRRAGAALSTRQAQTIMQAMQMGVISDEDLMEATGGVGGTEGASIMAQRMTQQAFQFSNTSVGRAMMLATGEMREGRYTGNVDAGQMALLRMGAIDVGNLRSEASRRLGGGRESRISFRANEERMRGEFAREAGPEMIHALVRDVAGRRGFTGQTEDDVVAILMRRFTDLSRAEAELMTKISKDYDQINKERARTMNQEMDRLQQDYTQKHFTSWEATKGRIREEFQQQTRVPELRRLGSGMQTSFEGGVERVQERMYGRYSGVIGQSAADELYATGTIASSGLQVPDSGVYSRAAFRGTGRRGQLFAQANMGVVHTAGPTGSLTQRSVGVAATPEELEEFQAVERALASGREVSSLSLAGGTQDVVRQGISATGARLGAGGMEGVRGTFGMVQEMTRSEEGRAALRAVAEERGMDPNAVVGRYGRRTDFGAIAAMGLTHGGMGFGALVDPKKAFGVSYREMIEGRNVSSAQMLELEQVMEQEFARQGVKLEGMAATGISTTLAAQQRDDAINTLVGQDRGIANKSDTRGVLESAEGQDAFTGWMSANAGSWGDFEKNFDRLKDAYGIAAATDGDVSKALAAQGMPGLSKGQADNLYQYMSRRYEKIKKMPPEKREKAFDAFSSAAGGLQSSGRTFAALKSQELYRNAAGDLSAALNKGMAANLRQAGADEAFIQEVEAYASASQGMSLGELTGGAENLSASLAGMSPRQQANVMAQLSQGGAMGYTISQAALLASGRGGMADDLRGTALMSRQRGFTRKQSLEGIAAASGVEVSTLEGTMKDPSSDIGQALNAILAANELTGEKEGVINEKEQQQLMEVLSKGVARGLVDAGAVSGGAGEATGDPMTQFMESHAAAMAANQEFVSVTTDAITRIEGGKTEDLSGKVDPTPTGVKSTWTKVQGWMGVTK